MTLIQLPAVTVAARQPPLPATPHAPSLAVDLALHVKPAARRSHLVEIIGPTIEVQIAAKPHDNEANICTAAFFAGILGLRRTDVALVAGLRSRNKTLRVLLPLLGRDPATTIATCITEPLRRAMAASS